MTGAERMRRSRQLKDAGFIIARNVKVPETARDVMVENKFLAQWDERDPDAVARAVERLLAALRTEL